jgi:hypothetical protein
MAHRACTKGEKALHLAPRQWFASNHRGDSNPYQITAWWAKIKQKDCSPIIFAEDVFFLQSLISCHCEDLNNICKGHVCHCATFSERTHLRQIRWHRSANRATIAAQCRPVL